MFFPLLFSTVNALHLTPFVCVTILSPLHATVPSFCRNKTKTLFYSRSYTDRAKVTVNVNNSGAALCSQCGSPRTEHI